ncbi:MAG: hypothetical protein IPJ13_27790 [Saprospiraceae bacterium]|nr:hypothetical protein [Saprospiraceae bacterium]
MTRGLLTIGVFFLLKILVSGQDLNYLKDTLAVGKLTGPVIFDGLSNEVAWDNAYKMGFITSRPIWGAEPSKKRRCWLGMMTIIFMWLEDVIPKTVPVSS